MTTPPSDSNEDLDAVAVQVRRTQLENHRVRADAKAQQDAAQQKQGSLKYVLSGVQLVGLVVVAWVATSGFLTFVENTTGSVPAAESIVTYAIGAVLVVGLVFADIVVRRRQRRDSSFYSGFRFADTGRTLDVLDPSWPADRIRDWNRGAAEAKSLG